MTPASEKFLAGIRNDKADVRRAAWKCAAKIDPEVIPQLAQLLLAEQPGVRKAAGEALKNIVHSAGKEPGGASRAVVVRRLIELTADGQPVWVRTIALRHLSLIGGDEEEAIQLYRAFLNRPEERLQCAAIVGLSKASTPEAARLIRAKLKSDNLTVRIAAIKAWAAIGRVKV
jgi:HEAT repeat protein